MPLQIKMVKAVGAQYQRPCNVMRIMCHPRLNLAGRRMVNLQERRRPLLVWYLWYQQSQHRAKMVGGHRTSFLNPITISLVTFLIISCPSSFFSLPQSTIIFPVTYQLFCYNLPYFFFPYALDQTLSLWNSIIYGISNSSDIHFIYPHLPCVPWCTYRGIELLTQKNLNSRNVRHAKMKQNTICIIITSYMKSKPLYCDGNIHSCTAFAASSDSSGTLNVA